MTLHVAAMYFDPEKNYWGFLLGADRRSGNGTKDTIDEHVILIEKTFRSENTIGVCSGAFHWPCEEHEELIRSFDGTFEDINEHSNYRTHPTLLKAESATLSIVKREKKKLGLYGVYTRKNGESVDVSVRKHRELMRTPYTKLDETPFWQDLTVPGTPRVLHDPGRRTLTEMQAHLLWTLRQGAKYHSDRISGPFDLYAIDFEEIRRVH